MFINLFDNASGSCFAKYFAYLLLCNTVISSVDVSDDSPIFPVNGDYCSGFINGYIDGSIESYAVSVKYIDNKAFISSKAGRSFTTKVVETIKGFNKFDDVYIAYSDNLKDDKIHVFAMPKTFLFEPLMADARQVSKGASYRFDDDVFGKRVAQVKFSGVSPLVRIEQNGTAYQFGIDGGVFAIFNMGEPSHGNVADLQNADYFGGLNFQIRYKDFDFRFRFYHISCHIGDDFISSLHSFPGEQEKQRVWLHKLNFIKATEDPYNAQLAKLYYEKTPEQNVEDEVFNKTMSSPHDASSAKDFAHARGWLMSRHGWVFSNKPSYEVIDFAISYQISLQFRMYSCIGILVRNNPTIDQGKGYLQIGLEGVMNTKKICTGFYIRPIYCLHIMCADMHDWFPEATYLFGIDISSKSWCDKKLRIYVEAHSGYSQEGMFRRARASYLNIGLSYHH